ncbi:hypothetical protein [Streptomyces adelaidensis]|nr:hypothetical protein [Streptomyces adelaidensis]
MSATQESTCPVPGLTVLDLVTEVLLGRLARGIYSLVCLSW